MTGVADVASTAKATAVEVGALGTQQRSDWLETCKAKKRLRCSHSAK